MLLESRTIVDEVRALLPRWAERAARAEADRRLDPRTAEELTAIGAHRLLQPHRYGGGAAGFAAYAEVVAAVGEACTSAAWCLAVWSAHNWMLALFDPLAQDDIWGPNPAARISASIVPRVRFERTADGDVVVGGRFPFGSGCDHADWFGVGGIVPGPDGRDDRVIAMLPSAQTVIEHDTWQVMGLRGTGSKDVMVPEGTVVPAHRVLSVGAAAQGLAPGQFDGAETMLFAPFRPVAMLVLAPPVIGAARAALDRFGTRSTDHLVGMARRPQRQDLAAAFRVAESSAEIDAAALVLQRAATDLDRMGRHAVHGGNARSGGGDGGDGNEVGGNGSAAGGQRVAPSALEAATVLRDTAFSVRLCARAVDRLYEASGGSALAADEPMQRYWRDVHAARTHTALTWDAAADEYAAAWSAAAPAS